MPAVVADIIACYTIAIGIVEADAVPAVVADSIARDVIVAGRVEEDTVSAARQ